MAISFNYKEVDKIIENEQALSLWIDEAISRRGKSLGDLSFIFLTDDGLLEINKEYLNHDYYTDVITFDYSEEESISGDIFISLDRVRENATEFNQHFLRELYRVIIHGVLHLLGYGDKEAEEIAEMRNEEEKELSLCPKID